MFNHFDIPRSNFVKIPRSWLAENLAALNGAEFKVVLYILMHTWGYQEFGVAKHITLDEFKYGRMKNDGTRIDKGTGLSQGSVVNALKKAMEDNFIVSYVDNTDAGRIKKYYMLRMNSVVPAETFAVDESTGKETSYEEWLKMAAFMEDEEGPTNDDPSKEKAGNNLQKDEDSDDWEDDIAINEVRCSKIDPRPIKNDSEENQGLAGEPSQKLEVWGQKLDTGGQKIDSCSSKIGHRTIERNYKKDTYKKDIKDSSTSLTRSTTPSCDGGEAVDLLQSSQKVNADTQKQNHEKDEKPPTNKAIIAELTSYYRQIEGVSEEPSDYAFIGRLYNMHGYDKVLSAINELGLRIEGGFMPDKPKIYLMGMLNDKKPKATKTAKEDGTSVDNVVLFGGTKERDAIVKQGKYVYDYEKFWVVK